MYTATMMPAMIENRPAVRSALTMTCTGTRATALWALAQLPLPRRCLAVTEAEMKRRISHLRSKIQHAGGVDILVTHAPLHGYGDFSDLPHRGFTVFNEILDTYHPALMLHGHIHLTYGANIPREHQYGQTRIVNCYERFVLDLPDKPDPRRHSLIERWKQFNRTGHF